MLFIKPIKLYASIISVWIAGMLHYPACAQGNLFNQDSLKLILKDFEFTEGPAVDKKGNVFFTDQPNNKIWKYSIDGKVSLFMDKAGRSNGLYFDKRGNLIACADEQNQLWSISPEKRVKVLVGLVNEKKLNGPNDLWIDPKGGIYFTDPFYQRDYWTRQGQEMDGQKVYYLPAGKSRKVILVAADMIKPNGIVGTPDGKYLYVADITGNKTYRYSITKDGMLIDQKVIINQGADGITLDSDGNIYLSGKGVFIFSPEGVLKGHIEVNEPWTANLCFGGKDRSDLFITASKAIYTIPMHVKGVE
ncbi:SMP-30/gluconolactonase/LRE family protein [Pedobacter sp. MR2016-24]|uniref:SMP-30/gluconolactonase/LRE family protein n=1 Tax=Pedobacter sp. MR2016-24 TaxID=2994466 RepID=UPI0022453ECC|nr:SMP-30/gluconolactonase/LRE family protein [Pedobacter sp. MR2016-24]MCX2485592.1 SMP-30/gluconolactonase/LRE family protein [Pedobacter sp. MR2016-24]